MNFTLLIVGADTNAYYMARCYHELTGKKAYSIAKNPIWFTEVSKIVIPHYNDNLREEKVLLEELDKFYLDHKDEKILLVAASENYIELISKNKDKLKDKDICFNNLMDFDFKHNDIWAYISSINNKLRKINSNKKIIIENENYKVVDL